MTESNPCPILKTPEIPLVAPNMVLSFPNGEYLYSGQNVNMAILPIRGYNQEDGWVMSQGAVDRGVFTSIHYNTYKILIDTRVVKFATFVVKKGKKVRANDVLVKCGKEADGLRVPKEAIPSTVTELWKRN